MDIKNDNTFADIKDEYIENNKITEAEVEAISSGRAVHSVFITAFIIFIFVVGIFHFALEDSSFSQSENRVLASMPKLTISSLSDGSFMKNFETYLTDQFPKRDILISAKTFCDRLLGKNKENGVYIGDNGFLFDTQTEFSKEKADALSSSINKFIKKYKFKNNAVIFAPNSTYVYSKYLPDYVTVESQKDMLSYFGKKFADKSNFVDVSKSLKEAAKSSDNLYYKTDHHWTTQGAFCAFETLGKKWKLNKDKVEYTSYTVSTTFEGTLASKAGVHENTDEIVACVPKNSAGSYVVNFESQGIKTGSMFFEEKFMQKNQYEFFFGGNFDKITISTTANNDNCLLIIKDSYANCFIPFLTPYFSKIVVVDPRYLTDNLSGVVSETSFTHVLFLYNLNTILADTSLESCLES